MKKKTSIIILTYNDLSLTKDCVESIRKYTEKNTYEIIIVDNHSQDETPEWLKTQSDLHVILNKENVASSLTAKPEKEFKVSSISFF